MAHYLPQLTPELIASTWNALPACSVPIIKQPPLQTYQVHSEGRCRSFWPSGHVLGPLTDRRITKWYGPKVERKVRRKREASAREKLEKYRAQEYV